SMSRREIRQRPLAPRYQEDEAEAPARRRKFRRSVFLRWTASPEIYTLSLHDALPISGVDGAGAQRGEHEVAHEFFAQVRRRRLRSEEHTSELQSQSNLVCRLLLEKKNSEDPPVARRIRFHPDDDS